MKEIYLVTCGSYSDYKVLGVFSSEKLANSWKEQHQKTGYPYDYQIEVYPLDSELPKLKSWWRSTVNIVTGEIVQRESKYHIEDNGWDITLGNNLLDHYYNCQTKSIPNEFTFHSYKSQEHADKIAIENHQKFLRLFDKTKLVQTRYGLEYHGFPKN